MSTSPTGFIAVPKGLAKVVVTDTELGDVRGDEGFFHYRQYSAVELAEQVGFEQAWHLLERGHLPDDAELAAFTAEVGRLRVLPPGLADLLPAICATTTDSLQVLRTTLSAWGGIAGLRPLYDCDEDEKSAASLAAVAVTPTILAAAHRLHHGLEPAPASRPASSGPSARSRAPSTAARRAGRSRPSTRSAPWTGPTAGCATASGPATGSWVSATPSTARATRARRCSNRSPAAGTTRSSTSRSGSRTPSSARWPS